MTRAMPSAKHAACRDEPDENLFMPDEMLDDGRSPGSPTLIAPLLICETCPVRRPCLEDALSDHATVRIDQTPTGRAVVVGGTAMPTAGIWGGSTERERIALAQLPVQEAADILERTISERLDRRIAQFEAKNGAVGIGAFDRHRGIVGRAVAAIEDRRRRTAAAALSADFLTPVLETTQRASGRRRDAARSRALVTRRPSTTS